MKSAEIRANGCLAFCCVTRSTKDFTQFHRGYSAMIMERQVKLEASHKPSIRQKTQNDMRTELRATTHCHVSSISGPHLHIEEGSDADTCPAALVLPRVLRFWTLTPCWRGFCCCHMSRGSRLHWEGLQCSHVPYGSGLRLPAENGSGAAMCPVELYASQVSRITKGLAGLAMQLGSRVSKTFTPEQLRHVRCASRRHHWGLQDVWTCDYSATLVLLTTHETRRQLWGDLTGRHHTTDRVGYGSATGQEALHVLKPLLAITSHYYCSLCTGCQSLWCYLTGPRTPCNCSTLCYKRIG
jgi:hypothetical protein